MTNYLVSNPKQILSSPLATLVYSWLITQHQLLPLASLASRSSGF